MPKGADPPDSLVWGQVLFEARELRRKQDGRLAAAQHQSQLVVAGFLAVAAIAAAIMSSSGIKPSDVADFNLWLVVATAVGNGLAWHIMHGLARHWREAPDIDYLVQAFSAQDHGPVPLQRHLIQTFMIEFRHNERLVLIAQRLVTGQTIATLSVICYLAVEHLGVL